MRIGVDACCWSNGRGYGRYVRELLRAMVPAAPRDEFHLFLDPGTAAEMDLSGPNVRTHVVELDAAPTSAASADGNRSLRDLGRMSLAVRRVRPDVFFSPSVYTWFPLFPGQRAVVGVHDAIADEHPELTLPDVRARMFWRLKVSAALRQARLVLTVSRFSARQIHDVLGVPRDRIRVAEEAPAGAYRPADDGEVEAAARRAGLPPGASWFVYVGGFNPHKHVDVLVRAHADLVRRLGDAAPHLLLVGTLDEDVFHGGVDQIRAAIREEGTGDRVHWTGFVPDDGLRPLHAGALALALPSECEGFGLPAVEAAACGTPVVATLRSPLPEILEGGGVFVEPRDRGALADALERLATDADFRRRAGREALRRASALTWERTAEEALGALREAAA